MIRWTMFTLGIVLIWLGWRLPFAKAVWDTLMVMAGSAIVLLFVYFPDLAYYGQRVCASCGSEAPAVMEKTRL
jgi:hypothetical protein